MYIAPLKVGGAVYKAKILNDYFTYVFTPISLDTQPPMDVPFIPIGWMKRDNPLLDFRKLAITEILVDALKLKFLEGSAMPLFIADHELLVFQVIEVKCVRLGVF